MDDLQTLKELDGGIVQAAKDIKVLSRLSWPEHLQDEFLASYRRGAPTLPQVEYPPPGDPEATRRLDRLAEDADALEHPLGQFLRETARSYSDASRMLCQVGTPRMSEVSIEIYGRPGDPLSGGRGKSSLDAAHHFLEVAGTFQSSQGAPEAESCVMAQTVKAEIEAGMAAVFGSHAVPVVLDPDLPSKAAAGANRIRLRDRTCFTEYSAQQLLQHEALVHTLTAVNGRAQPHLTTLSLGAPRTTAAQEGLATLAELVAGAIDIPRLVRIAERVVAIDAALSGADFIEVFRLFLAAGQPEVESFNSTMRVFRGVPLEGGSAFTKDAVYLRGMLEVHTFFSWAMKHDRFELCRLFFAGRMSLADLRLLEPHRASGLVQPARFLPPWMTRATGLGGYLAFSLFANEVSLGDLSPEHEFHV